MLASKNPGLKDESELMLTSSMINNQRQLSNVRTASAIVGGLVAGILGFESIAGVVVFLVITLMGSILAVAKMGSEVSKNFLNARDVMTQQFFGGFLSFILFWTLSYDMVHIF